MDLAQLIDHTLLKPDATQAQISQLCQEARANLFCSVCVNPIHVEQAVQELRGCAVKVCTVVGFPLGSTPTEVKLAEARWALARGAHELDMVMNIGAAKSSDWETVEQDIRSLAEACHHAGAILKVIIEACLLTEAEKVRACEVSVNAGADFVKTSTGFSTGGATVEDVALMRKSVGPKIGVKASGGIKSKEVAKAMIAAGASRLGTSSGVQLVNSGTAESGY